MKVVYISPTGMSTFCLIGMSPGSNVLLKGLLYTKMAGYMFILNKLLLYIYGYRIGQLAERLLCAAFCSSRFSTSTSCQLEVFGNVYCLRCTLTQNSELGGAGAVRAHFQQPSVRPGRLRVWPVSLQPFKHSRRANSFRAFK